MFDLQDAATETPIVKLVNALLSQAVTHGASDVHFEAEAREMRVRIRVDGVLEEIAKIPGRMVPGVVSRIKIMCELDISERRLPQDGRVGLNVDGKQIDIRVVTLPTVHGESVVMRILDRSNVLIEIPKLGLDDFSLGRLRRGHRARPRLGPRHRPHRIRESRPRSTRSSTRSTRPTRTSSPSRTRSNTSSTASPRSPSTRRRA